MITKSKLTIFNNFLKSINLDFYREKYKNIKTFEADMTTNIQAIKSIYKVYWNNSNFLNFEDYYRYYYLTEEMIENVKLFNENKIGLCQNCLFKGLEARIYRTWASLITQIQAAYCCGDIFGLDNVFQSVELDHLGIDIKVLYKTKPIGIQIKKLTGRREIVNRKPEKKKIKK